MKKAVIILALINLLFILTSIAGAEQVIQSIDISNYPQKAKEGYFIFSKKCIKCHSLDRPLNAPYTGEAWKTTVYRMMRKQGSFITRREADKVYAFLVQYSSTRKPIQAAVEIKGLPLPEAGRKVYEARGCKACHTISGIGGRVGPELTTIGKTRDSEFLYKWLKNPQAVKPGTVMPNLGLTDKELKPLVEYLAGLK